MRRVIREYVLRRCKNERERKENKVQYIGQQVLA
jgi:hypothetical protein